MDIPESNQSGTLPVRGIRNDELAAKHDALGARLRAFCNLPFRALSGEEGNVNSSLYKLEAVSVVTRHGHRAPILPTQDATTSVQCDLNETVARLVGYPALGRFVRRMHQEVHDTLRRVLEWDAENEQAEGPKVTDVYDESLTRVWNFFNFNLQQCPSGQLSQFGVVQFLELGRHLRRVYIDGWNLLDAALQGGRSDVRRQFDATLKTTGAQRTHLSGISLMHALLDLDHHVVDAEEARLKAQAGTELGVSRMPLPYTIKKVRLMNFCDAESQFWLAGETGCMCVATNPLAMQLYEFSEHLERESPAVRNTRVALLDFLPPAERFAPLSLLDLLDFFVPEACYTLQMPCVDVKIGTPNGGLHIAQQCLKTAQLEALFSATEQVGLSLNQNSVQKHFSTLFIYPLLSELAARMRFFIPDRQANDNRTATDANSTSTTFSGSNSTHRSAEHVSRFTLYSGHDFTVSDLLRALDLHRGGWPGFATRVVFELYSSKQQSDFFLRILLNGADVTSEVEPCVANINQDGLCPFQAFERFVLHEMLPRYAHANSFAEACQNGALYGYSYDSMR